MNRKGLESLEGNPNEGEMYIPSYHQKNLTRVKQKNHLKIKCERTVEGLKSMLKELTYDP